MKTISTYIELLSAMQIACIRLFVLHTLRFIRDCALFVLVILTQNIYCCSCTRTRASLQIINRKKFAVFQQGAVNSYYRKKATL